MSSILCEGLMLYGYCNGFFGRDSYGDKRVVAWGVDWIVVREEDGTPNFCHFEPRHLVDRDKMILEWSQPPKRGG